MVIARGEFKKRVTQQIEKQNIAVAVKSRFGNSSTEVKINSVTAELEI